MAFEDGFNREVTISRRTSSTEETYATIATAVPCRIVSMKLQEIQAIAEVYSERASHTALLAIGWTGRAGDRLTVTAKRVSGGEWESVTSGDRFAVLTAEDAEGADKGPHHVRLVLSMATPTG